ncbi:predicted protein [Histoplasma mississippiense (nom. inval.)]|uniref:predicted protein n=1 Tax=Ajellomyces capsulatus (strain NAm1 / WU24) TaxID=2059318 RepID=UPI000157B398|nr:predicted protein [Histoplasma mississippiense (nom. inval.)]EDN02502.1 predicted protein [Histoplasma mississippiense (nom. inval.)]
MATFTYDTTSPGPADGSPSPQLHTVHLLEACTSDPRSDEEPQHLHPMPMPMLVFPASGDLFKDAASEEFAGFSALPSTVSGLDDINWDEWILFDSSPVDVTPPSLQLSDFSDDPIEEAHPSQSDVADDPPNRREPTPPLASDNREGNTLKEPLNYSDSSIEADPRPGEERHVQVHRSEQVIGVRPLGRRCVGGDAGSSGIHYFAPFSEDPIIIDEPMSPNLLSDSDPFVAIPSLQRNIEKVPGGYKCLEGASNTSKLEQNHNQDDLVAWRPTWQPRSDLIPGCEELVQEFHAEWKDKRPSPTTLTGYRHFKQKRRSRRGGGRKIVTDTRWKYPRRPCAKRTNTKVQQSAFGVRFIYFPYVGGTYRGSHTPASFAGEASASRDRHEDEDAVEEV